MDPVGCTRRHNAAYKKLLSLSSGSVSVGQPVHQWHTVLAKGVPAPDLKHEKQMINFCFIWKIKWLHEKRG